jgi:hypothetical protein
MCGWEPFVLLGSISFHHPPPALIKFEKALKWTEQINKTATSMSAKAEHQPVPPSQLCENEGSTAGPPQSLSTTPSNPPTHQDDVQSTAPDSQQEKSAQDHTLFSSAKCSNVEASRSSFEVAPCFILNMFPKS